MSDDSLTLRKLLTQLNGREPPLKTDAPENAEKLLPDPGIGYSQLNKVLLLLGYNRVSASFFQYLIDNTSSYNPGAAFTGLGKIRDGVDRFRKHEMWYYGNIRFAFIGMSGANTDELNDVLSRAVKKNVSFFFSSRRRHTRLQGDWSSDVCSSDSSQKGEEHESASRCGRK